MVVVPNTLTTDDELIKSKEDGKVPAFRLFKIKASKA
jgi:hypothetical protein